MDWNEELKKALDPLCRWDEAILRARYSIAIEEIQSLEKRLREAEECDDE